MNAISSINAGRKHSMTQTDDSPANGKRTGPVADAVLALRIMVDARTEAKMVLMDLTSYVDAVAHLEAKLAEEAERQNISADFEKLAEHSLEDALRVVEFELDELMAHLMSLAVAMKAENAPVERIRPWVQSAADSYGMAFRIMVPVWRLRSLVDAALREPPPDDAEPAGEAHLGD